MAPPGGSATLYGVLYQLLASVHGSFKLRLQLRGQSVLGARIVVEPTGGGGDLRIELPGQRIVEQWKARTTDHPWSIKEIVGKVLPDLYLALSEPNDDTNFVFATEGFPSSEARAFFERYRGAVPQAQSLAGISSEDREIFVSMAAAVRKRKQFRSEPDTITFPKLRRLLSRFEIRDGQKAMDLANDINRWLLPLIDIREEVGAVREQLCTKILSKAAHGEVVIVPENLLREVGIRGVSLENPFEWRRKAREGVEREVGRRKYDRDLDVRARPEWPDDKPFLVLAGESGQGKTWQLARLALDLANVEGADAPLAVFLSAQGDVAQQAANLLWQQALDRDHAKSLDRIAAHWREVRGESGRPWLVVCADGTQTLPEARALIESFDWGNWGVRLALSVPKDIGIALARELPDQIHLCILRDFTLSELRQYLRHCGRIWEDLPPDVRETLRRPLLARLYTTSGSGSAWKPTLEYELYEGYWRWLKSVGHLSDYPEDLVRVKRLALTLLDHEPLYPWTWDQLERFGLTDEPRRRLELAGWWVRTGEDVEVWHDRLLSWALAESVAERGSADELANWLRRDRRPTNPRIWRILAYLPLDVLWLLSGGPAKRDLVTDLIVRKEEEDQQLGSRWLYEEDLPSLGKRIVPSLIERLRRLPDNTSYAYLDPIEKALSTILDREPAGRSELPSLLGDASQAVCKVVVGALSRHPHPEAVELLWARLREASRSIDETHGERGLTSYRMTFPSLRSCLELDLGWLKAKILGVDPIEEPVWELAYLLGNLKHPAARSLWLEVKSELFRKMPGHKLRSLTVCIRAFLDADEVARLEGWLSVEEDFTNLKSFRALAWVDPDRAIRLLATLPLENLAVHHFGSWLPILLLKRPEETRQALRARMSASQSEFWEVADLYIGYDEKMDRETLVMLLDRLSTEEDWDSLRRPLHILARLHRHDLLKVFEERAGTELDRRLGELCAESLDSPGSSDWADLRSVLLKIGGEGIRRAIQTSLRSTDSQGETLRWARMFPDETAVTATRDIAAHALLAENRFLVQEIVALDYDNPYNLDWRREWLTSLWYLRRGQPPMSDEDLVPAFDALSSHGAAKRMRGLDAVSVSGRSDLLSLLPEWLEGFGDLESSELQELDRRAYYLARRLAGEVPEDVIQKIDFERFPFLLGSLYGKVGAEALPDRLELHLLNQLGRSQFGATEMDFALTLARSRKLAPKVLREVWNYGRYDHSWNREVFWKAVVGLDSGEFHEDLWKAAQDHSPWHDDRVAAITTLALLEPDAAFEIAARHLRGSGQDRDDFVEPLLDLDQDRAIPVLVEQSAREQQTKVLWTIARALRTVGPEAERVIRANLERPEFRIRRAAVHLAGWQGPGFLEMELQRMATEDPDNDIQWECLHALDRQHREACVRDLMSAFSQANGIAQWSYLESILELGDPRLLTTESDPLWLGRILASESGALEVHANWRLKDRFQKLKRAAEQRDRDEEE